MTVNTLIAFLITIVILSSCICVAKSQSRKLKLTFWGTMMFCTSIIASSMTSFNIYAFVKVQLVLSIAQVLLKHTISCAYKYFSEQSAGQPKIVTCTISSTYWLTYILLTTLFAFAKSVLTM